LNQTLRSVRLITDDEDIQRRAINAVASVIPEISVNSRPPEIAQIGYQLIRDITGNPDPYKKVKSRANRAAMRLYPAVKNMLGTVDESLFLACKLAIAGNSIDHGPSDPMSVEQVFESALGCEIVVNDFGEFKNSLKEARRILYLGDNAGEIVFDRVLIEEIKKVSEAEIYFMVRGLPVINDVTVNDAAEAGLDKICQVISSGTDAPGTVLEQFPLETLKYYHSADIIISKGQGNYESLEGEPGNIFFFLKAKCNVSARLLGVKVGDAVLRHQSVIEPVNMEHI